MVPIFRWCEGYPAYGLPVAEHLDLRSSVYHEHMLTRQDLSTALYLGTGRREILAQVEVLVTRHELGTDSCPTGGDVPAGMVSRRGRWAWMTRCRRCTRGWARCSRATPPASCPKPSRSSPTSATGRRWAAPWCLGHSRACMLGAQSSVCIMALQPLAGNKEHRALSSQLMQSCLCLRASGMPTGSPMTSSLCDRAVLLRLAWLPRSSA